MHGRLTKRARLALSGDKSAALPGAQLRARRMGTHQPSNPMRDSNPNMDPEPSHKTHQADENQEDRATHEEHIDMARAMI